MDIRTLQLFLSSLRPPLHSVGAAHDIEPLVASLEPYADWSVSAFTDFLRAADGFRRNGQVHVPGPDDAALSRLGKALSTIRDCVREDAISTGAIAEAQEQAIDVLTDVAKTSGITLSAKTDKKWLTTQRTVSRTLELAARCRKLASQIVGADSYAASDLQVEIEFFASLSAADWKSLETSLKITASGKGRAKAESALGQLSGHTAPKPALQVRAQHKRHRPKKYRVTHNVSKSGWIARRAATRSLVQRSRPK